MKWDGETTLGVGFLLFWALSAIASLAFMAAFIWAIVRLVLRFT